MISHLASSSFMIIHAMKLDSWPFMTTCIVSLHCLVFSVWVASADDGVYIVYHTINDSVSHQNQ